MRPLLIDDAAKAKVRQVRDFAEQPANLYRPGLTQRVPGDDPHFVTDLAVGFHCVFTITEVAGVQFRHLSISVDGGKYPSPFAAYTIAELFGFEGWNQHSEKPPAHWHGGISEEDHCIILAEPIGEAA